MLACKLSLRKATLAVPVLVTVTEMLFVVPTCTLPKFAAEGLKDRVPAAACAPLAVMAARPVSNAQASRLAYRRPLVSPRCE